MSFTEFHELLTLLNSDNIVSDEEFLLLYDTFKTKILISLMKAMSDLIWIL